MQTVNFNALPIPATNAALPEALERAIQQLNGPLRDVNNSVYELAKPLERSRYPACPSCGIKFHLFRRKCNCANCGQVICSDCLDSRWYLPKYGVKAPVYCCRMCDRNLSMSIKNKDALNECSVRELRAYLQLYGLYNPSTMLEKDDLVTAIYNNSPMPQINETKYRQSLPQPSMSDHTSPRQQEQARNTSEAASDTTNSWDRTFADIGNEIGRAFEGLGQQFSERVERGANAIDERMTSILDVDQRQAQSQNTRHNSQTSSASNNPHNYDSRTYSHSPSPRTQRSSHPRTQPRFYTHQRPQSAQGTASSAASTSNRSEHAVGSASPAQLEVPALKSLVKDNVDASKLSIKTLKALLTKHRVDYSNIVEKKELIERVERLVHNTKLEMEREAAAIAGGGDNGSRGDNDEDMCKICWDASVNCVFLNCGHMCTCIECGDKIVGSDRRECPICREYIAKVVHVFRA
ncbi:hypothetical protein GGI25_003069 [Coemansia spiralis]|uniref:RING-type domain-containing protein n=2 Tax=Coemansia TaxID=4863 RepID=A0A9W8G7S0_9FUNG|nr:hypothetical protein BX070DRAFT_229254 [Coemansia spiralis]KAJ1994583.1 hypothetical protein EDC05_001500 [Coemansia umbellata]KAJ2624389.1 hypothetical protein GGI26_001524 [Coemansia sp. RSA 1358]KAJ2677549.1 hypothetical protein GGI25_003069 [Coemansia spiralis]